MAADLGRRGCAAAGEHAQPREQWLVAVAPLRVEVREEERHRAAEHRRAVRGEAFGDVAGSNDSNSASRMPVMSDAVSMSIPPMCEMGIATALTSSGWHRLRSGPPAPCMTERSVWRTPFGSAVVPDDV